MKARAGRLWHSVVTSDIAWFVVTLHATVLILCTVNLAPSDREFAESLDRLYAAGGSSSASVYAGRPFHFTYESVPLKVLTLLDLPALILAGGVERGLEGLRMLPSGLYYLSYVSFSLDAVIGSAQWLLLGSLLGRRPRVGGRRERLLGVFRSNRKLFFGGVVAVAVIAAPLLQWRSNTLGFRHAGISFWSR
jgi:hypothetical protein